MEIVHEKGFGTETKATSVLEWLKADYDLGRGHGMAIVTHSDPSDTLLLDGVARRSA